MVFRRDNKAGDAFQRQISALRQQLGDSPAEGTEEGAGTDLAPAGQPAASDDAYGARSAGGTTELAPGLSNAVSRAGEYEGYGGDAENVATEKGVTGAVVPTAPELPSLPVVDALTTVIAQDAVWKGEITSEGTIHIHGRFEGAIRARSDVYVADQANVDATVNAGTVVIAGLVKGTIRCGSRFEVLPTGRVTGDVHSPTLVVHEGAVITGQFRMGTGEPTASDSTPTPVVQRRATRGSA
jgi:cytoskeletal protein CcmA (bactofilin family)